MLMSLTSIGLQIEAFTQTVDDLGSANRAFAQAKEKTQANIKYLERNLDDLRQWLQKAVLTAGNQGSVVG